MSSAMITIDGGTAVTLKTARGKTTGTRYNFVGQVSASGLRAEARAQGLKGAKATAWVNARLNGDSAKASSVMASAFVAQAVAAGYVFTSADVKAQSVVLRGQKPTVDTAAVKAKEAAKAQEEAKKLAAENEAMKAELAAIKAKLGIA